MPADGKTRTLLAGKWLLVATAPLSALAIGSLHTTSLIVLACLAAISAGLLWASPPTHVTRASRMMITVVALLLTITAFQMVPLPATLVASVAPSNGDVWARSLSALREEGPRWHPISVAPVATRVDALRGAFYGCLLLAALRVALMQGGRRFLERVVVASAVIVALVTLAHAATQAQRVFGIYIPRDTQGYTSGRLGPLLNPNHFAAYCNIGAIVATGVALREKEFTKRVLFSAAAMLLSGTSVWAGSRGGTASLLLGLVLAIALSVIVRRGRRGPLARSEGSIVLVAVVASAALVGLASSELARTDLAGRDMTKLEIVRSAFGLVPRSPILGFGRGSFETIFPLVRDGSTYSTFLRPENIIAQWTIEWGIPVTAVACTLLAITLRPRTVLQMERPPVGAWVAVWTAVLHELVDFHFEVPGIVALVMLCIAIVIARGAASGEHHGLCPRFPRRAAFALAFATALGVVIAVPDVGHSLPEERDAIARAAMDPAREASAFSSELRAAILRYPAEPFFPLAGAVHAQTRRTGPVIPWIARALERYPNFGRAHFVLARELAPRRTAQARLEYRLAYSFDERLRGQISREAHSLVTDIDSALELVPQGALGVPLLESLATATSERLPATSALLDEEIMRRDPTQVGPLRRKIRAATSDVRNDHPWCADSRACLAPAMSSARELIARDANSCEPRLLMARLRIASGERSAALDELLDASRLVSDRAACLREIVQLAMELGDKRRADDALDQALRGGCGARDECLSLYSWAAEASERRGNHVRAIAFYKRAAELAGGDNYLVTAAELAERAGLDNEAADAFEKLAVRHPENERWRTRAAELRSRAAGKRFDARGPR